MADPEERSVVEGETEADADELFYDPIDLLLQHGISAQDIGKLKASGITTINGCQMTTRRQLAKVKGLSEVKVEKIKEACNKIVPAGFLTAQEVSIRREQVLTISTGSRALDTILSGGIMTQSISEAYGEFRTGKTQLCHTLCLTTQLPPEMGGAAGKVAYIDTEGTFRPDRIRAIAERFGVDANAALENIAVARAWNSEHQAELLNVLAAKFAEEEGAFKLLIVDSIMALFRTDFCGRGELSERQQKLNQMLARLSRLACEFNVAVLLTNQVQADPGNTMAFGPTAKAVGGHILSHASATRLYLRKGRGDERVAKLVDSPDAPEAEASYCIKEGGITDVS